MGRSLIAAAMLAAAAVLPGAAHASVTIVDFEPDPGYLGANKVIYTPIGNLGGLGMTRFHLWGTDNGSPFDLLAYCADVTNPLHPGTFEHATVAVLTTDLLKQTQLLALLTNTNPLLAAATGEMERKNISAATQLAVWEIIHEASNSSYDTKSGMLWSKGGNSGDARNLANEYLAKILGGVWTAKLGYELRVLFAEDNQSQIYAIQAAVPEPSTWMMMIGGVGLIGAGMRRRRTSETAATA